MTDSEKAEEYVNTHCCYYRQDFIQAYLDGLSEGRKELEQWKQEWQDTQIKANEEGFERTMLQIKHSELEKENAELKAEIENLKNTYRKQRNKRIDGLQKENAKLKEQNENYQLAENESKEIIAELKAQTKSMRMEKGILIAKLKSYDALWNEQQKVIKEKQAQIEKMKNVGNCKYAMQCPDWVKHKIKDDGIKPCINCVKWEFEE